MVVGGGEEEEGVGCVGCRARVRKARDRGIGSEGAANHTKRRVIIYF